MLAISIDTQLVQTYRQLAQHQLQTALQQQEREIHRLTRKLANSAPAAWVLQRQRNVHLERQLRECSCAARQKLAERTGREMLHFAVDKVLHMSQELGRYKMFNQCCNGPTNAAMTRG